MIYYHTNLVPRVHSLLVSNREDGDLWEVTSVNLLLTQKNRPFPSCFEPHYEANCKKISFACI